MISLRGWISTLCLALALLAATGCSRRQPGPKTTAETPAPPPPKSEPAPSAPEPPPEDKAGKPLPEESASAATPEAADESSVASDGRGPGDAPQEPPAPAGTSSPEPGGRSSPGGRTSSGRSSPGRSAGSGRPTAPPAAFSGRPKQKQNPTPDAAARSAKKQLEAAQSALKRGHSAAALTAAIAAYEAASEYAEGSPQCDRLAREAEKLVDTIGRTNRPAAVVATEFE